MKRMCLSIVRSTVILPFTAGNPGSLTGFLRLYNCSTSATVMLTGLLAMIVVFTASLAISKDLMPRLMTIIIIMATITVVGLLVCCIISYIIFRHGTLSKSSRRHKIKSQNLQLAFLWLFAIASSILFGLNIIVQIECSDSVTPIKIVQSSTLVLFLIWETVLISVLASYHVKRLPLLRYSVRILIAVDLSVWFNASIRENTTLDQKSGLNDSHVVSAFVNCVENSTCGKLYVKSWQFFSPALVEFSLLAATLLAEIVIINFSNNGTIKLHSDHDESNATIGNTNEVDICTGVEIENFEEETIEEELPLIPNKELNSSPSQRYQSGRAPINLNDYGLNPVTSNSNDNDSRPIHSYSGLTVGTPFSLYVIIGLSVLLSLPTFIGYLMQATLYPNNLILTLLLSWYEVAIKILMLFAVILGFYSIERITAAPQVSNAEPFGTKDWIFLLSVFSMFVSHCFEMLVGHLLETEPANAIFVANCVSVAQDYFQTVLLLHAVKCRRNVSYDKCVGFVSVCLFMTITNFGCWTVDVFIIAHSLKQTRMDAIRILEPTVWTSFSSIFLPLTMYYRFASALAFHELYKTFKAK